jgi:membrane protein YdbS with pleckstrin-like domain
MSVNAMSDVEARFSPKLKVYIFVSGALVLAATVVGILLIPLWLLFGGWWVNRYHAALKCRLTDRSVIIGKGVFFRQELTIPLDKIQDISVREGPLLTALGLLSLRIETAGQRSATTGKSEADLLGLIEAREIRDQILLRRDRQAGLVSPQGAPPESSEALLTEIRDSLLRIERHLVRGNQVPPTVG